MVKTATASRCEATAEACGGDLPRSPWTQNEPYRVSLPAELTSFVGRRTELSSVKRLLRAHRLVTLVGIGGVGKSRLAIRAAQTVCDNYRDGVRFVELGDVTDPSDLAVALTVAAQSSSTEPRPPVPGDDVADAGPANRRMLIVLDNCEHLVGACARLVTSLLRAHPDLSVLATSRQPLRALGETLLELRGLRAPDPGWNGAAGDGLRYDAVRLFFDRADAIVPSFSRGEENYQPVAEICRRVDGLPLAIEIAAGRLTTLSSHQILERLPAPFQLLTGGNRGGPARHQSLQESMFWSYRLCSKAGRALWARLSVFDGAVDLSDIEGVCAGHPIVPGGMLDAVASLVDQGILQTELQGDCMTYRMLATVRQFGRDRLRDSGAEPMLRERHFDWYEQLLLDAESELVGPRQAEWFQRLPREFGNVRSAIEYGLTDLRHGARVQRILVAVPTLCWWSWGRSAQVRDLLARAASMPVVPMSLHPRLSLLESELAFATGDWDAGAAALATGERLAAQLGDHTLDRHLERAAGVASLAQGDVADALTRLDRCLADGADDADRTFRLSTLALAVLTSALADEPEVRTARFHREIVELAEPSDESFFRSFSYLALGLGAWRRRELRRANHLIDESLRLKIGLGDLNGASWCLQLGAWVAAGQGRSSRAATLLGASHALQAEGLPAARLTSARALEQECERRLRSALGTMAYRSAVRRGSEMTPGAATTFAICEEPPSTASRGSSKPALSTREYEIAELLARGLTNKQIATALVIAPRTAESHVEHVLVKLGLNRRTQVAEWVRSAG